VGRPNAGKSTLINSLIKQKRLITSEHPGTTRDSIDINFNYKDQDFTLIDTAGLRKRGKIELGIEKYSSMRALNSIERADIVCLMMDYSAGIRAQDLHISSFINQASKGLILVVNKLDLMKDKEAEKERIVNILKNRFDYLSWAPVVFASAKNCKNIYQILDLAQQIQHERYKQIEHQQLTNFLQDTYHKHFPPTKGLRRLYFYDINQTASAPPTFDILVNNNKLLHFSYQRYLENQFREKFGYIGTNIEFYYRDLDPKLIKKTKAL
jgi:GTP-binding protein